MPTAIPCPRCNGTGALRTTVPSTRPDQPTTHPTVGCPLCRGTGQAMPWGQPLPGTQVPAPTNPEDAA